jgi:ABC-type nickel/cobalt efflux system permease component RcnA
MDLASAYPDSAISAWMMTVIALVMVACLAAWLILVFRADSRGSARKTRQAAMPAPAPAGPDRAAEDEHGEAGHAPAGVRHGAAA